MNLPDASSDDNDDLSQASTLCPVAGVGVHASPVDVPCMATASNKPMMDEIGQESRSLCGIVPLQKKLCKRVAAHEACKPLLNVIGGDKNGTANGNAS